MKLKAIALILVMCLPAVFYAAPITDSLLLELQKDLSPEQKAFVYLEIANSQEKNSFDAAMEWVNKADAIAQNSSNQILKKRILREKGYLFQTFDYTDSSIVYFRAFLGPEVQKTGFDSADVYNRIGVYHISMENPDSALSYLNKGAEILQRVDNPIGLVEILTNTGNAFYGKGDLLQTKNYFEQAYFLGLEIPNYENIAVLQSNYMGIQFMLSKDPSGLMTSLQEILKQPAVQNNPDMQANVYINSATIYLNAIGDLDKAEELFQKALVIYDTIDYRVDPHIYAGLGDIYAAKGQFDKAIDYQKLGLKFVRNLGVRKMFYQDLASLYSETGNTDSASFYYQKTIEIIKENQIKKSEELQLQATKLLEIVKRDGQISRLESQHKIDVLEQNRSNLILGFVSTFFVLLVIVLFLLFNRKKREAALHRVELKLKNKDLVNLSLHINEKNQILKEFEEKLASDKETQNVDKALYTDVQNTLKRSLKLDDDWQQFEVYLNDLHGGFYTKLKESFPNLTKTELRVCSLSKLRYSLKETAQTLSISTDSVKSARYRVKKKLNLTAKQDLADYLNNI